MRLTLTSDTTSTSAILHIAGEVDYTTTPALVSTAVDLLDSHPALRHLHVDCAEMAFCDSAGISALLAIHQRTSAAGVRLHLDRRPAYFERVLHITGILEHLTAAPAVVAPARRDPVDLADESGVV